MINVTSTQRSAEENRSGATIGLKDKTSLRFATRINILLAMKFKCVAPVALLFLLTVLVSESTAATSPDEMGAQLFREKIQPVLEANCFECHSANATKIKGGLRLDS